MPAVFYYLAAAIALWLLAGTADRRDEDKPEPAPRHEPHPNPPAPRHWVRRSRHGAFDLGTTEDGTVTPEQFVALEQEGFYVALTAYTNELGHQHAIVVVAASESHYRRHEALR